MKRDSELWRFTRHRRGRWLNNRVEQDHRRIKRRVRPMLGFKRFVTARRTLAGIEARWLVTRGQVREVPPNNILARRAFVPQFFGFSALPPKPDQGGGGALSSPANATDPLGRFRL